MGSMWVELMAAWSDWRMVVMLEPPKAGQLVRQKEMM